MSKVLKLSKQANRLRMAAVSRKVSSDFWTGISGSNSWGKQPIFLAICGHNLQVAFVPGAKIPGSLYGIIESKKSSEWWNLINDKNREWTDCPKQQESQTQYDYNLVHITLMRKTHTR